MRAFVIHNRNYKARMYVATDPDGAIDLAVNSRHIRSKMHTRSVKEITDRVSATVLDGPAGEIRENDAGEWGFV